jgi:hypothetical protein
MELTDRQIVLLHDIDPNGVPEGEYLAAKKRLELAEKLTEMFGPQAELAARIFAKWEKDKWGDVVNGTIWQCAICGRRSSFESYKTGRRKGRPKPGSGTIVSGYDYTPARRIHYTGAIPGKECVCYQCNPAFGPLIQQAAFELEIQADLTRLYKDWPLKEDNEQICFQCKQPMWESEMGRLETLMGNGIYPGQCPKCGAKSLPFGTPHTYSANKRLIKRIP